MLSNTNRPNNDHNLDYIYCHVDFDRELVFKFFTIFSLFEYAIKKAGFCRNGNSDEAQPDWRGFAQAIHGTYNSNSNPALQVAINYFLNEPPMKQIYDGTHIIFLRRDVSPGETETQKLSIYIRRVRNNLFHGGKFRYERPRDALLIQNALIILDVWSGCNPRVLDVLQALT